MEQQRIDCKIELQATEMIVILLFTGTGKAIITDYIDFHEVFDFEILVQTQPEMLRPVEKLLIVHLCTKGEGLNRRL